MKKLLPCVLGLGLIAGCTVSSVYTDATVIMIDGEPWFVRPMQDPDTWQAGPDKGQPGIVTRPAIYATNIKAIEQVSGCSVIAGSVTNISGNTLAAVDCTN